MKKKWDVNGCYYAKEEASIQEDIKVLEKLKNKKYIVDKVEGWEQYLLTTRQQIAIENLIARNKELEENQCCMTVCMRKDREKIFIENKIKKLIQRLEYFKNDKDISKERKEDIEAEIVDLKMLLQEGDK